jgi:hypothetical protein
VGTSAVARQGFTKREWRPVVGRHPQSKERCSMTSDRFRELVAKLFGDNQMQCARDLEKDPTTIRRWISGRVPIPTEVAMLLETMEARGISAEKVREYWQRGGV